MTAFFIAHRREITDPDRLKQYRDGIDATIERFGGQIVVRADGYEVLEGEWHSGRDRDDSRPERLTVIAFPDMESLKSWYDSDDYAPLKALRQESAVHDVAAVQGV
ncbi:MAG: DUF1330 domain-containing protein [Rhodospirillales bacterium]